MRKSKAFKVVHYQDGIARSAVCNPNRRFEDTVSKSYGVVYRPNSLILPKIKNSKLFVFKSLEHAKHFENGMLAYVGVFQIWQVEAHNVKPLTRRTSFEIDNFRKFWDNPADLNVCGRPTPDGTLVCDSLVLIKKVK